jgi:octaprenyl-diphosphate synthase
MRRFGELIGLAFQIRDDLFDFGDNKSGKPAGIDIKEKKLTLPLIYAFSQCSGSEVRRIKTLIRSKTPDKKKIAEVVEFINQYGGLVYARNKMTELKNEAFSLLEQTAEPGKRREDLLKLVNFVIEREQ